MGPLIDVRTPSLGILMCCDNCGAEALALKTCRFRMGEIGFVLCDACWEPLRDTVWIVPGPVACFGTCALCGEWVSARDLRDPAMGGRRDAWRGTCRGCV